MNTILTRSLTLAAALLAFGGAAVAQTTVKDGWVRSTVEPQKATGAFMQITSAQGGKLIAVQSPAAGVAEVHEMAMDGNVMKMRAVPALDLPAGKAVELKPGGYHVMLMDLKQAVKAGETVPLTLTIEGKGSTVKEGVTTCGGKPGELVLAEWKDAKTAAKTPPTKIYRSNFADVNFKNDYSAYTLAFVPKGSTDINPPSSAANIEQLGSADSGGSSAPGGSSSATVPTGGSGTPSNGTGG